MIDFAETPASAGMEANFTRTMLSRNETESLCLKAARGAGFSWGLAEEAGFAAGWLAAHGIDGTGTLLALLTQKLGKPAESGTPRPMPGHWQNPGQHPLCPVTLGAALCDSALLSDGPFSRETHIDLVAFPILLLPFLARAAQIRGKPTVIGWQGRRLLITANGAFDQQAAASWIARKDLAMTIRQTTEPEDLQNGLSLLPPVSMAILNGLNELALRTTVPATVASRQGAGSSTADND